MTRVAGSQWNSDRVFDASRERAPHLGWNRSESSGWTRCRDVEGGAGIFAAFWLSVSYALVGAIIGEFVGPTAGLGYQLIAAEGFLQTDRLYATLVLVGVVAAGLTAGARVIEDRVLRWRPPVRM